MSKQKYVNRLFDGIVEFSLKSKGALVIVGPKWCGKSTTAKRYAKTVIDLMPLDSRNEYRELAKISPTNFLNYGPKPILIDEWQHVSFIWDQVKYEVDKTGEFGQYILTGEVFQQLEEDIRRADADGDRTREIELTSALEAVRLRSGMIGSRLRGRRFDMGNPAALVETITQFAR